MARAELTANALRDWCRLGGTSRYYIEPDSPWENPFVESFASRVRDEVLAVEAFAGGASVAHSIPTARRLALC